MPKKILPLSSYPEEYFGIFTKASKDGSFAIKVASLKAAQYMIAELNIFRMALRKAGHRLSERADDLVMSPRSYQVHDNPDAHMVYIRAKSHDLVEMRNAIGTKIMEDARTMKAEAIKQEHKQIDDMFADIEAKQINPSEEALLSLGFGKTQEQDIPKPSWLDDDKK